MPGNRDKHAGQKDHTCLRHELEGTLENTEQAGLQCEKCRHQVRVQGRMPMASHPSGSADVDLLEPQQVVVGVEAIAARRALRGLQEADRVVVMEGSDGHASQPRDLAYPVEFVCHLESLGPHVAGGSRGRAEFFLPARRAASPFEIAAVTDHALPDVEGQRRRPLLGAPRNVFGVGAGNVLSWPTSPLSCTNLEAQRAH